jgi:hypothetical protein
MSLGQAMEVAVRSRVGVPAWALVPDEAPDYAELRRLYGSGRGSNERIAAAAGYPKGAEGRKTFLRRLQRYEQYRKGKGGQASRPAMTDELTKAARKEQARRATPKTVSGVIRMMGSRGTTTSLVKVTFSYASSRQREIDIPVYTARSVYVDVGWPMGGKVPRTEPQWDALGELFLEAFCIAYGIPAELAQDGFDDAPVFHFTIGREAGVQYDYT